ncbi:hypothetical protein I79_006296 [Cricetulus griseus]|uniref:Uncharacterized protein n=1 Tax=Cricetulus griseus TaxID=10029 RepID=G3H7G6_CRIGR|nr:hypothetical protein I79_006296 [Cricetulus griseus]
MASNSQDGGTDKRWLSTAHRKDLTSEETAVCPVPPKGSSTSLTRVLASCVLALTPDPKSTARS